ncbi:MAG TPA: hypothetical protein VEH27_18935 [Methylomirabilota bacterium]|nr:hypothetical protein [Methylomirabilota bacterium]
MDNVPANSPDRDRDFRSVLSASCGIAVMGIIAAVASLKINGTQGFHFDWDWTTPIWMLLGVLFNWRLWIQVWKVSDNPTREGKVRLGLYLGFFVLAGVFAFLYPLRFIAANKLADISFGLVMAVFFLGGLGTMMVFVARAFNKADEIEIARTHQEE